MPHVFIRITLSYDEIQDTLSRWADKATSAIAYQHHADEEVSKTHVHIVLYDCILKHEALKRMFIERSSEQKGNKFWSWKDLKDDDVGYMSWYSDGIDRDWHDPTITYMSKGVLQPVFVKNISQSLVEKSRQAWVEPPHREADNDSPTEHYIKQVLEALEGYTYEETIREIEIKYHDFQSPPSLETHLFEKIKSYTFRLLYNINDTVPYAGMYKTVASTAFIRLMTRFDKKTEALFHVRNHWYK